MKLYTKLYILSIFVKHYVNAIKKKKRKKVKCLKS